MERFVLPEQDGATLAITSLRKPLG